MPEHHTTEPTPRQEWLLFRFLAILRDYAQRWTGILRGSWWLSGFLLLNFVCFNGMVVLNVRAGGWSLLSLIPFLPLACVAYYGGLFILMVFAAHTAKSGPTPPEARRPWAELTVLLFYLFGFVFWGAWANLRGHSDFVLARGLTALLQGTEALYAPLLRLLHVPEAWREGLHSVHGMGTYPFLFLLAMGNRPGALGFRWPHAPRWTMWAWAALPVIEILSGNLRAASGFPTALLRAALPEELAFRAGLQTRLEILLGHPARALVLTSLLFAVMHLTRPEPNPAWALANCLGPKAIVGFGFGYLYYRTRSLWPSVFLHAAVDVTFFGG